MRNVFGTEHMLSYVFGTVTRCILRHALARLRKTLECYISNRAGIFAEQVCGGKTKEMARFYCHTTRDSANTRLYILCVKSSCKKSLQPVVTYHTQAAVLKRSKTSEKGTSFKSKWKKYRFY
jgi:hypothetical protein